MEDKLKQISSTSSEALAAQVVLYRTLKIDKEVALVCMQELANRRDQGDSFPYEEFIETEVQKFPKIEGVNLEQLSGLFSVKTMMDMLK